ncbi:MAG: DUF1127 domain-containing protein [Rhodospirillales bacterium]|nr:DUF1127 domain-containing protein [Rhodospirillales bacterium]
MLADVGILRSDIGSIVEKSYPRISVLSVLAGLLDKLAESRKNHEIARELASFDDRLLADMGLYRSDVSSIAKGHYPHRHVHASPLRAYGTRIDSMTDAVNDDQKRAA